MTYSSDDELYGLSTAFASRLTVNSRVSNTSLGYKNKTSNRASRNNKLPVCSLDITPVLLSYESASQYRKVFYPLIVAEAEDEEKNDKLKVIEDIPITWYSRGAILMVYLPISDDKAEELKLTSGKKILLRHIGTEYQSWEAEGLIEEVPKENDEHVFKVILTNKEYSELYIDQKVSVSLVWNDTKTIRLITALDKLLLKNSYVSTNIFNNILGFPSESKLMNITISEGYGAENLPPLNKYQISAVKNAIDQSLTLIQGPPGTGKTVVSATIIYTIVKYLSKVRILVCASSNVAVDNLAEKIYQTGIKVVRVCARTIEKDYALSPFPTLHGMTNEITKLQYDKEALISDNNWAAEIVTSYSNKRLIETEILENADVILSTCIGSGDQILENIKFHTVLVDEATQATEPESLISVLKGCERLILVGDHKQLGPVVVDDNAKEAGYSQSLFERLIKLKYPVNMLKLQFRMHPSISKFPSTAFYEDKLLNGISAKDRTNHSSNFPWPHSQFPVMFYSNLESEGKPEKGFSFLNHSEALKCLQIIERLIQDGVKPDKIGVITFYDGQRYCISKLLEKSRFPRLYSNIKVASVDAFQGREKDYIIISCVRSNASGTIGFLYDPRRLNVALTRAKMGLIVVGNPQTLRRNPLWRSLLMYIQDYDALVEGPLDNLRPFPINMSTRY